MHPHWIYYYQTLQLIGVGYTTLQQPSQQNNNYISKQNSHSNKIFKNKQSEQTQKNNSKINKWNTPLGSNRTKQKWK